MTFDLKGGCYNWIEKWLLTSRSIIFQSEAKMIATSTIWLSHSNVHSHVCSQNWARSFDNLSINGQGLLTSH